MSYLQNGAKGRQLSHRTNAKEQNLISIKERVDQISASMKQSQSLLKSTYGSLPQTPESNKYKRSSRDLHEASGNSTRFHEENEIRVRTPPKKHSPDQWAKTKLDPLADFLNSVGLEELINVFNEHQVSFEDLQYITKEDLIDMNISIGPRNRIFNAISNLQNENIGTRLQSEPKEDYNNQLNTHTSPKRLQLKEEVDQFMSELTQLSKRNETRNRPSSRQQSFDSNSFESAQSQRSFDTLKSMLIDISEKQEFMMKAIRENQRAISILANKQNVSFNSSSMSRGRQSKSPSKLNLR